MGPREFLGASREHWRITLLVVLLVIAGAVLFLPHFAPDDPMAFDDPENAVDANPEDDFFAQGWTNLQFGLELSGGTRVRAPLVGLTAEGLSIHPDDQVEIESTVAEELGVSTRDVNAVAGENDGAVELLSEDVRDGEISSDDFATALRSAGLDVSANDIRSGTTEATVDEAVRVVEDKIRESPFARGSASKAVSSTGEMFVVVEVPGATRGDVVELIEDRGVVEVVAHYPVESNGTTTYQNETVLEREDFQRISPADESPEQGPHVPVVLTEPGAETFSEVMIERGFTTDGVGQCRWDDDPDDPGWCLLTVVDGEVVYSANIAQSLADTLNSGDFLDTRNFVMTSHSMGDARNLAINLRAGALPAPLHLEAGTQYFLEPSLAADFKIYSLVTGLIALFAVAGVVFLRYGRPRVAVPMVITASAEVFLLLGFAAAIGYPLDLAAIAGFIAVVGTGVDDLIIIADEILQQGDVSTSRVFASRFKKAFWVIGVAAATTIVAMTPIAFMSLGDLTGFALFMIIGILIGVLITRPAYGDILRILMTREQRRKS